MLILGVDTKDFYLQYLGRVFRTVDVKPLIVDIVDDHPLLKSHFRARKKSISNAVVPLNVYLHKIVFLLFHR